MCDQEYEVEKILSIGGDSKNRLYLVHWKGYEHSDDTWEPRANLSCKDLLREYANERRELEKSVPKHPKTPASNTIKKIVGCVFSPDQKVYVVQYQGEDFFREVTSEELRKTNPKALVRYLASLVQ